MMHRKIFYMLYWKKGRLNWVMNCRCWVIHIISRMIDCLRKLVNWMMTGSWVNWRRRR